MLTAAVFELDGVLVDAADARAESLAAALAAEGLAAGSSAHPAEPPDWLAPFDDLARVLAPDAADETTLALIALRAEREYAARVTAGVTLAPGARDAVAALATEWRVGVVTGWRRADAERILALAGLDASVRFVAAADDGPSVAPARDRIARALARLRPRGAPPAAVAALVATPAVLAAARAAEARTVLVASGSTRGGPVHATAVGADARLASLRGLTPARLAAALDVARDPAPPRSLPYPPRR